VWIDGWSTVGDGGGRLKGKRRDTGGGGGATTLGGIGGGIKKVVQGGGAYVVYDVVIKTREGTEMRVFKRYSEFEELRERLGRVLGVSCVSFLSFSFLSFFVMCSILFCSSFLLSLCLFFVSLRQFLTHSSTYYPYLANVLTLAPPTTPTKIRLGEIQTGVPRAKEEVSGSFPSWGVVEA